MQALLVCDKGDGLLLRSKEGEERSLPIDLYDDLSALSDEYDPKKNFIGFVDPVMGVILAEASVLEAEYQMWNNGGKESNSFFQGNSSPSGAKARISFDFPQKQDDVLNTNRQSKHGCTGETSSALEDRRVIPAEGRGNTNLNNRPLSAISSSGNHQKVAVTGTPREQEGTTKKTMHQLAYEKKTGLPLPSDENRPISGFGIKQGKLQMNSTTFNAYHDQFHSQGRTVGEVEKLKLTALVEKLNKKHGVGKQSRVCLIM